MCATVFMQDMTKDEEWHARNASVMTEMVHPRVDYLTSGDEKYIEIEVHVNYAPRHPHGEDPEDLGHRDYVSTYSYDHNDVSAMAVGGCSSARQRARQPALGSS